MSNSLRPHGLCPARLLCPWNSPGKNIGVSSHSLLQGIFPVEGQNPDLHCRQILYHLSHQGSPYLSLSYLFYAEQTEPQRCSGGCPRSQSWSSQPFNPILAGACSTLKLSLSPSIFLWGVLPCRVRTEMNTAWQLFHTRYHIISSEQKDLQINMSLPLLIAFHHLAV